MADLPIELRDAISLSELAKSIDKDDSTVRHWLKFGRKNKITGKMCFLTTINTPSGMRTSWAAYEQFVAELNAESHEHETDEAV